MAALTRRERERLDVRDKILEAARRLLSEHGKEGFTMRKIAAEIEYSPTVIYSHFKDKQALISALATENYSTLTEKISLHRRELNPVERLYLIGKEIINFALENPNHYSIFTLLPKSSHLRQPMLVVNEDSQQDIHEVVVKTVCDAIQTEQLCSKAHEAELIAQTFFAGIHGTVTMGLNNKNERINKHKIEERLHMMIDLLIRGLIDNRQTA